MVKRFQCPGPVDCELVVCRDFVLASDYDIIATECNTLAKEASDRFDRIAALEAALREIAKDTTPDPWGLARHALASLETGTNPTARGHAGIIGDVGCERPLAAIVSQWCDLKEAQAQIAHMGTLLRRLAHDRNIWDTDLEKEVLATIGHASKTKGEQG